MNRDSLCEGFERERERESKERNANMWGTKGVVTGLYRKYRIPLPGRYYLRSPFSFYRRFVIKVFLIFFILSITQNYKKHPDCPLVSRWVPLVRFELTEGPRAQGEGVPG